MHKSSKRKGIFFSVKDQRRKTQPSISNVRARSLPFCISATAWIDLLGYGEMIGQSKLNPIDKRAKQAIDRLRAFHRIVAGESGRFFRTLVLNDGAVAYRDLSLRDEGVTHDFIKRSVTLFEKVADSEKRNGWPGARMVLSPGFRAKGSRRGIDGVDKRVGKLLQKLADGKISAQEAVREAGKIERDSDVIPQLQANFAFTRSYVAERAGSKAGLGGAKMFIDTVLFCDGSPPSWVEYDQIVPFEKDGLGIKCNFASVTKLCRPGKSGDRIPGLRDGLEVGEAIATTIDLKRKIRKSR